MATDQFDAVVVGSGATGGWAAKELTEGGLHVALLEAGPMLPARDVGVPLRETGAPIVPGPERQPVQQRCYAYDEASAPYFVDDLENPYTHPQDRRFDWIRSRQVGGRLLLWDRVCVRMTDRELKAASHDGVGEDWPLGEEELLPYYERVERFLRVTGMAAVPVDDDGEPIPVPPLSAGERQLKQAVEQRWPERVVEGTHTALAPPDATLKAAMRTGRLSLFADSVASRVSVAADGSRVTGVAYVERLTGAEREIAAPAVFLCASTIESTRLLLNSAGEHHPDGLGNSSGLLGRYLMDHTFSIGFDGFAAPPPRGAPDPLSFGCFIPSFRNVDRQDTDFVRGYGIALQIRPRVRSALRRLRNRGRRAGGYFWMRALGEVLPERENRVSIDTERVDAWGIPVARIDCRYGENEKRMARDQLETLSEIVAAAGMQPRETHSELGPPGISIHEVGTARMGSDPESSVLDPFNRCWDVENLFVTDGACFVSSGYQNPTLTMMALTARACQHHLERLRKRESGRAAGASS